MFLLDGDFIYFDKFVQVAKKRTSLKMFNENVFRILQEHGIFNLIHSYSCGFNTKIFAPLNILNHPIINARAMLPSAEFSVISTCNPTAYEA